MELLGGSTEVEASFDRDEEDIQGKIGAVHRLGDRAEDNTLVTIVMEVAAVAP